MKFTSEDLMKVMGLNVGDKVKVKTYDNFEEVFETYEVIQKAGDTYLQSVEDGFIDSFAYLIDQDLEILPKPKRVGDLRCEEIDDCRKCPLHCICFIKIDEKNDMSTTLEKMLNSFIIDDQEILGLLKARLDKEVLEC